LRTPQGIAVDSRRGLLYVADPTLNALVRFDLQKSGSKLRATNMKTVVPFVETRWVSLDSAGNVYFTVESLDLIMKVTIQEILAGGSVSPTVVYEGRQANLVAPGGIAMDNYHLFWVNKWAGSELGTLVRASKRPREDINAATSVVMARRESKAYGVCLTGSKVFFTSESEYLFSTPRGGRDPPVALSSNLGQPRGCVFDGDNRLYVADKKKNAVYSFNAGSTGHTEVEATATLEAKFKGVFGVAIFDAMLNRE